MEEAVTGTRRLYLFGASELGRKVAGLLHRDGGAELVGFLDNDPDKWGQIFCDLPVRAPAEVDLRPEETILITSQHAPAILDQLHELGLRGRVAANYSDWMDRFRGRGGLEADWLLRDGDRGEMAELCQRLGEACDRGRGTFDPARSSYELCLVATSAFSFQAEALMRSVWAHDPHVRVHLVQLDSTAGALLPEEQSAGRLRLLPVEALIGPVFRELRDLYSGVLELCCAVRPFVFEALLPETAKGKLLYLDNDIVVLDSLDRIARVLEEVPFALSPHLLEPCGEPGFRREFGALLHGLFNGGLYALRDDAVTRTFLAWHRERLRRLCRVDVSEGLSGDQKWLDLVPIFYPEMAWLRDPGVNVGHWNRQERDITWNGERFLARGSPLGFFHYSMLNLRYPLATLWIDPEEAGQEPVPDFLRLAGFAQQWVSGGQPDGLVTKESAAAPAGKGFCHAG